MTVLNETRLLAKIEPLNKLLESRFGLRVSLTSVDNLADIRQLYMEKREMKRRLLGEAAMLQDPDYAKAVLITEAIAIILREIAPKRLKRKAKR